MWQARAVNSPYETLNSINYRFYTNIPKFSSKIDNSETDSVEQKTTH